MSSEQLPLSIQWFKSSRKVRTSHNETSKTHLPPSNLRLCDTNTGPIEKLSKKWCYFESNCFCKSGHSSTEGMGCMTTFETFKITVVWIELSITSSTSNSCLPQRSVWSQKTPPKHWLLGQSSCTPWLCIEPWTIPRMSRKQEGFNYQQGSTWLWMGNWNHQVWIGWKEIKPFLLKKAWGFLLKLLGQLMFPDMTSFDRHFFETFCSNPKKHLKI